MGSITNQPQKKTTRITLWRRLTQTVFVFLLNPYFFTTRSVCVPVLNCWGCPIAAFACPIGALGQFFAQGIFPFLVLGLIILSGVLVGRMFCGWMCPFGFLQDLLYKIPSRKLKLPHFLTYTKYLALLLMVILIPAFFGVDIIPGKITVQDFFFCRLCPAGSLEATIPIAFKIPTVPVNTNIMSDTTAFYQASPQNVVISLLKSPRILILLLFLVSFILISRSFCRGFCPLGAIFALLNRLSIYKLQVNKEKCNECKICHKVCPMNQAVYITANTTDCIRCLECERKCPGKAIENQYF